MEKLGLWLFNICAALVFFALAVFGWTVFDWDEALNVALLVMAVFITVQTIGSDIWMGPYIGRNAKPLPGQPLPGTYSDACKHMITTQGVVLGLISFSEQGSPQEVIKVGAAALVVGVLAGTSLYYLVANGPPPDGNRGKAASVLMSVLLWSLGFGLICVVADLWSE